MAQNAKSAIDLHNAFFGVDGKFCELFPTRAEREAFAKTPQYQEIVWLRKWCRQPCPRRMTSQAVDHRCVASVLVGMTRWTPKFSLKPSKVR
jgi:hypothetical protein